MKDLELYLKAIKSNLKTGHYDNAEYFLKQFIRQSKLRDEYKKMKAQNITEDITARYYFKI